MYQNNFGAVRGFAVQSIVVFIFYNCKSPCRMKMGSFKFYALPALLGMSVLWSSCTKKATTEDPVNTPQRQTTAMAAATVSAALQGRALAANCFQCHGTNGYASELKIAGINASGLLSKFSEMRARGARDNIMNVHAFGYTNEEVQLIGDYFSKQ
jgi:cytochrome subunit of sulfide dehydrogenase